MATRRLGENDNGQTISIRTGARIVITLDENPTTGYRWDVDQQDAGLLALSSSEYTPGTESSLGVGGTHQFVFEAIGVGRTQLSLKLWRDWEGDASITRRYVVTLEIT